MNATTVADWFMLQFKRRSEVNPSYSLRAFARDLEISSSFLYRILKGTKKISADKAIMVSRAIRASSVESATLSVLVEIERTKSLVSREKLILKLSALNEKSKVCRTPTSRLPSDLGWNYRLLLEFIALPYFNDWGVHKTGQKLGIPDELISKVIKNLLQLNLAQNVKNRITRTVDRIAFDDSDGHEILKKMHLDFLEKSTLSLQTADRNSRFAASEMILATPQSLEVMKKCSNDYIDEIHRISKDVSGEPRSIYAVSLNLFKAFDFPE